MQSTAGSLSQHRSPCPSSQLHTSRHRSRRAPRASELTAMQLGRPEATRDGHALSKCGTGMWKSSLGVQVLRAARPAGDAAQGSAPSTASPNEARPRSRSPSAGGGPPAPTSWGFSGLATWSSMSGTTCKGPLSEDMDCLQGERCVRSSARNHVVIPRVLLFVFKQDAELTQVGEKAATAPKITACTAGPAGSTRTQPERTVRHRQEVTGLMRGLHRSHAARMQFCWGVLPESHPSCWFVPVPA